MYVITKLFEYTHLMELRLLGTVYWYTEPYLCVMNKRVYKFMAHLLPYNMDESPQGMSYGQLQNQSLNSTFIRLTSFRVQNKKISLETMN